MRLDIEKRNGSALGIVLERWHCPCMVYTYTSDRIYARWTHGKR